MEAIKTVRIVASDPETQGFYVIINEEDFDKKTMKVYDGPDNPEPAKAGSIEQLAAMMADMQTKLATLSPEDSAALQAKISELKPAEGADGWGAPPKE